MERSSIAVTSANLYKGINNELQLVFVVDGKLYNEAQNAVCTANERLKQGKEVGVTVEQIKRRRSLDANAYFHVLCSKIAEKTQLPMDEVKGNLVVNYGTPMYMVTIPEDAVISRIWPYNRFIGWNNGQAQYLLYKQTHTLNSSEMARLIDGAIQEARQLDIQTLTPSELAELQQKWEASYGRSANSGK